MNEKGKSTLKICEQKLNYLNYSKRTIDNYPKTSCKRQDPITFSL